MNGARCVLGRALCGLQLASVAVGGLSWLAVAVLLHGRPATWRCGRCAGRARGGRRLLARGDQDAFDRGAANRRSPCCMTVQALTRSRLRIVEAFELGHTRIGATCTWAAFSIWSRRR